MLKRASILMAILVVGGVTMLGGLAAEAAVTPVVADLGTYPPFKNNDNTSIDLGSNNLPVYVKFTLNQDSTIQAGVKNQNNLGMTGFNIVQFDSGSSVATGISCAVSDCGVGPFNPNTIDYLVVAANLVAGTYAFQVTGSGGATSSGVDMIVRVTGTAVPIPGAILLLGSALAGLGVMRRRSGGSTAWLADEARS